MNKEIPLDYGLCPHCKKAKYLYSRFQGFTSSCFISKDLLCKECRKKIKTTFVGINNLLPLGEDEYE